MLASVALLLAAQGPDSGDAALARMADAMKNRRAVSFVVTGGFAGHEETLRVRFLAPNLYAIEGGRYEDRSDGKVAYNVNVADRSYRLLNLANEMRTLPAFPGYGLVFPDAPKTVAIGPARTERFDDHDATAVPVAKPPETPADLAATLLLDPATALPVALRTTRGGKPDETYRFRDVQLDPPLTPADFAYRPPSGYRDANAAVSPPAAVPEGVKPAPKSGPPLASVNARPGVWTGLGRGLDVRLLPGPRPIGASWAFTVEARTADGLDWSRAFASVQVGPYAANGEGVRFDPRTRRATVLVPRAPGAATPTGLSLNVPRKDGVAAYAFRFDLRPAKARPPRVV